MLNIYIYKQSLVMPVQHITHNMDMIAVGNYTTFILTNRRKKVVQWSSRNDKNEAKPISQSASSRWEQ